MRFPNPTTSRIKIKVAAAIGWLILAGLVFAVAAQQQGIVGQWYDAEQGVIIEISRKDGAYVGWVIAIDNDADNERLQNYRAQGHRVEILKDFVQQADGTFCGGTIRLPRRNKVLTATLRLPTDNLLEIEGHYGLLSGTRRWERR